MVVFAQRCGEAHADVPVVIGGTESSLRRIAHYDHWSDKVRRSVLFDTKAGLLVYGNGERQIVEIAHRRAAGTPIAEMTDIRGTAFVRRVRVPDWTEIDSMIIDMPGRADLIGNGKRHLVPGW